MRGIFSTFVKRKSRRVIEFSECVFAALYDDASFADDMGTALQKAYAKYGETRNALVLDVSPYGEARSEKWMTDILPQVLNTSPIYLGPYHLAPSLSSLFEVCADVFEWLRSGYDEGVQRIVIIAARDKPSPHYRPLTAVALAASAYLTYIARFENGMEALDDFRKQARNAHMVSENRLTMDTFLPNLYQYLRFFTILRINKCFPISRPLVIRKILAQGLVTLDDVAWKPIVKVYHAKYADHPGHCTTISIKDRAIEAMLGQGCASFDADELIAGDVVLSFENRIAGSSATEPLFSIARHARFMNSPYRVGLQDIEMAPGLQKALKFEDCFGIDIFADDAPLPDDVGEGDFSDRALLEYVRLLGPERGGLIGRVAADSELVEDLSYNAPDGPPPIYYAMHSEQIRGPSADFLGEMRKRQEERKRQEMMGDGTTRTAEVLQEVLGLNVDRDTVDEFLEVFKDYAVGDGAEDGADPEVLKSNRKNRAKTLIGKSFIRRPGSHTATDVSSEDDTFGDIAQFVDEVEITDLDAFKEKLRDSRREIDTSQETSEEGSFDEDLSSVATITSAPDSDEESERVEDETSKQSSEERDDATIIQDAVRVLLQGVKTTGRNDRFRPDDMLKKTNSEMDDDSVIVSQITEALQALITDSKEERKFWSKDELINKVNAIRHGPASPSPRSSGSGPPPPPPPGGLRAPVAGPGASSGPAPPPPPPPPPRPGGAAPAPPGGAPPPPPPPPPRTGAKAGGPPPPPPPPSGLRAPTAPPLPPTGGPPPPPPPPGGLRPPVAPPAPPAPKPPSGGPPGPPPPPPPPGGLRPPRAGPGAPPPPIGGLRPPKGSPPLGPPPPPAAPRTPSAPPIPKPARSTTKPLHWNTLSNKRLGTSVFANEEFQAIATLDDDIKKDLQAKFSNAPMPKKFVDEEEEQAADAKGPKNAGILEPQRITNLEIMLRKFDATPREIAEAVRTLDPLGATLSVDNVNALISNYLKPEELELAKAFDGDAEEIEELNRAEALAYYIARVPRWQAKVKTMFTMHNSQNLVKEITTTIDTVINATKEVSTSQKLKRVLASVLAIGNYMNAGTAKGSARGFRVDSLQKLSETKMREGGQTLLHYMVHVLAKKHPECLTFSEDMPSVIGAKRMAKEDIAKEVLTYQGCVTVMGREVTVMTQEAAGSNGKRASLGKPLPPPPVVKKESNGLPTVGAGNETPKVSESSEDAKKTDAEGSASGSDGSEKESDKPKRTALEVATEMHRDAETNLAQITSKHEEMLRRFSEMAIYLGEDARHAKIEELFATIANFMAMFNRCVKENKEREENEARKLRMEKRQAEEEEKAKARAAAKAKQEAKVPALPPSPDSDPALKGTDEISPVSVAEGGTTS